MATSYPSNPNPSSSQPSSAELHLLYVLLDSNLPTGGFVSSSGLESFAKHGFLSTTPPSYTSNKRIEDRKGDGDGKRSIIEGIIEFSKFEIENYSMTTCCFVFDSWKIINQAFQSRRGRRSSFTLGGNYQDDEKDEDELVEQTVRRLMDLDKYNENTLLSHVVRRSSKAQGVAMLTLYTRGLSEPVGISREDDNGFISEEGEGGRGEVRSKLDGGLSKKMIDLYKKMIRKNHSPGHLAVCWGVITCCLGLSLDRAIHLHLFLHARSLLSSAVRLNLIGPYASSQLLLHPFKRIIDDQVMKLTKSRATTGVENLELDSQDEGEEEEDDEEFWSWTTATESKGPTTTWPLGEILSSRHDLQHSRIFNS